jgi:hypothetical protein
VPFLLLDEGEEVDEDEDDNKVDNEQVVDDNEAERVGNERNGAEWEGAHEVSADTSAA